MFLLCLLLTYTGVDYAISISLAMDAPACCNGLRITKLQVSTAPSVAFVDDSTISALKILIEDIGSILMNPTEHNEPRLLPATSQLVEGELPRVLPDQGLLNAFLQERVQLNNFELSPLKIAVTVHASTYCLACQLP